VSLRSRQISRNRARVVELLGEPTDEEHEDGELKYPCVWCDDDGEHLGINVLKGVYHCFRCHRGGSLQTLAADLGSPEASGTPSAARRVPHGRLGLYRDRQHREALRASEAKPIQSYTGPDGHYSAIPGYRSLPVAERDWPAMAGRACDYIKDRLGPSGFPLWVAAGLSDQFDGKVSLSGRLILPLFHPTSGELLTYQARDVVGGSLKDYNGPRAKGWTPMAHAVYCRPRARDGLTMVIVEGIWDSLVKWPRSCLPVAICGSELSEGKLQLLYGTKPRAVVVCLDSDVDMIEQVQTARRAGRWLGCEARVALWAAQEAEAKEDPASVDYKRRVTLISEAVRA
jgi:hypothetical protein